MRFYSIFWLVIAIAFLSFSNSTAQIQFVWEQLYGSNNNDRCYASIRTADGGYLMAGTTDHLERYEYRVYLIKLDRDNEIEWSRGYDDMYPSYLNDIIQIDDDGYLIVGSQFADENSLDGKLIRIDNDGEILWEQTYGNQVRESFIKGLRLPDAGYIIYTEYYNDENPNRWEGFVIINDDGEEVNSIRLFDSSIPVDLHLTENNELVVLSKIGGEYRLVRVNLDGEEIWNTLLDQPEGLYSCFQIEETTNHNFILSAMANSNPCLISINAQGEFNWANEYESEHRFKSGIITEVEDNNLLLFEAGIYFLKTNDQGEEIESGMLQFEGLPRVLGISDVFLNENGNYEFFGTGRISNPAGTITEGCDFIRVKIDNNMNLVDWDLYGFPFGSYEIGRDLTQTDDGIAIAGCTKVKEDINSYNLLLLATDNDGDSLWSRQYYMGEDLNSAHVLRSEDGGYFLAGSAENPDSEHQEFFLLKTDESGDSLWTTYYYERSISDRVTDFIRTSDGFYILAGGRNSNGWVVKVNEEGGTRVRQVFEEYIQSVKEIGENTYVLLSSENTLYIVNEWLEIQEEFNAVVEGEPCRGINFTLSDDGGYYVVGRLDNLDGRSYITRLNADGEVVSQWIYMHGGLKNPVSIHLLEDNNLLFINGWRVVEINNQGMVVADSPFSGDRDGYLNYWDQCGENEYLGVGESGSDVWLAKLNIESLNHDIPDVSVDPLVFDFGNVQSGEVAQSEIMISNVGGGALYIYARQIEPEDSTFQIIGDNRETIEVLADSSCAVQIRFSPRIEGFREAVLRFETSDLDEPEFEINLRGSSLNVSRQSDEIPLQFSINGMYPNPFNSSAVIEYSIPETGPLKLTLVDIKGRELLKIVDGQVPVGEHRYLLSGYNLPSGIYYVKMESANNFVFKKVVCIR